MRSIIGLTVVAVVLSVLTANAFAGDIDLGGKSKIAYCGVQWKQAKQDATVKANGWPAYWSFCSKALKSAGVQTVKVTEPAGLTIPASN